MSWSGFEDLDLTDVEPDDFAPLELGEHIVTSSGAKIEDVADGRGRRLVVTLKNASGSITTGFNIKHPSDQAQDIARRQLKAFLLHGGHRNPDKPGSVDTLNDLRVGIYIGNGKPFTNKEGKSITPREVKRFFAPADASKDGGGGRGKLDDHIPF
ncbi:hypothetical protein [Poseidonocella sp. HB161398]|uniref:hypothetical protein n=1 Tax=Poseidonocella sp. HB161398 TaxID=2320855 RepID=UPI0011091532|nr:hypothetical protein [Poseidonocella sp. HB161398]